MGDDGRDTETNATAPVNAPSQIISLLVPFDSSPEARSALPYAVALGGPGTEIVLLTVIPAGNEISGRSGEVVVPADETSAVAADDARAALEQVAQRIQITGQAVRVEVAFGDPATRILDTVKDLGATMIVMGTHGRGALGRLFQGSVADTVAREAVVPTMVVRGGPLEPGPVGITRLVVPLDGTPFAEASLAVAEAISKRLGTSLFLVEAVDTISLLPPAVGFAEAIPAEIYDEAEKEMEQSASDYLEGVATRLRGQGLPVATGVLSGPPATAIIEATKPGDVVVMCSHERSGVMRWLQGSVSEQLVRNDQSPVILVPAPESVAAGS
jgi:nucleotide-binding universal stress UspA family protein